MARRAWREAGGGKTKELTLKQNTMTQIFAIVGALMLFFCLGYWMKDANKYQDYAHELFQEYHEKGMIKIAEDQKDSAFYYAGAMDAMLAIRDKQTIKRLK